MIKFISFFAFVILVSCNQNNQSGKSDSAKNQKPANKPAEIAGCYESIFGKDSTQLHLELIKPDSVKGILWIHYFQKDKADGKFAGAIKDEMIIGWYTFNAEGKNSVRQMVFKSSGDSLIEGYGNIAVIHDTAFFKDINDLNYLNERPLIRIACP